MAVSAIASFLFCFQLALALKVKNEPWNKWGCFLSLIVFLYGIAVFFQHNLGALGLNRICEAVQTSSYILLVHASHEFSIHYLKIRPPGKIKNIWIFHLCLVLAVWWPGLIVGQEFVQRNFIWLSRPYVEPDLTIAGKILLVYLVVFGVYVLSLWFRQRSRAGKEGGLFLLGCGFLFVTGVHDFFCNLGFRSVQYLTIYGYMGMFTAIIGIMMTKYISMFRTVEQSVTALERSESKLKQEVEKKTRDLILGTERLKETIERLKDSEQRISALSDQNEQFSLAAASMLTIGDEKQFFANVSRAIARHSDYERVLISLFKETRPFREIIGYAGLDESVIQRLKDVEMPASQYDHVFEQGHKVGLQSYYIPYDMKDILKQEATVYGDGHSPQKLGGWHPKDNLFVKMINEKQEFIGVISVDDSKSGLKPSHETVRPLELFSNLISQILLLKKEQEKNQILEEQLMQARKMESIGTLTGGIAHDFNNILGIIMGNAELGLEKASHSDPVQKEFETIRTAGNRAAGIVRQLLSFGRNNTLKFVPLRVKKVLEEAVGLMNSTMPSSIEIHTHCEIDDTMIMADSVQINQVFLNLCSNAAQSMAQQTGIIRISCSLVETGDHSSENYPELRPGKYVRIKVEDNGKGISPKILDRIFEPYFTTKDFGKGSGIGLAVVYGIVKNHKGTISVTSREGAGTCFNIFLPKADAREQQDAVSIPLVEAGHKERVLVVDDEEMLLDMMVSMIERIGYQAKGMSDPVRALEAFRADPERFHVVLTDMTMPGISGTVLAGEIKAVNPKQPVIICTGFNETIQGRTARDLNVSALLMKPVRLNVLSQTLSKVLN